MIEIRYSIRGLAAIRRRFTRWADPGRERRALRDIALYIYRETMRRFETETDPWGRPWAPMATSTLARRPHGGSRILQDTGRLLQSFHWRVEGDAAAVRAGVRYAVYHQFGTRTRSGRQHLPPRKMLPESPWPERYLRAVRSIVRRYYGVHRP